MRCFVFSLTMTFVFALGANAQGLRFGYLSYDAVLKAMPDYALVQASLSNLRSQYEAEALRAEKEFNTKYEEFLDGQRDFPQTILQKRQSELQELLERNVAFRDEARRLLAKAEEESMAPLRQKLADALLQVGITQGYAFILNTDQNACPFINPEMGEDVSQAVLAVLP